MKIALAYHGAKGNANKFLFIGCERGYHGVGFGGISVGGIVNNRKAYTNCLLPGVDHLQSTYHREHHAFTRGQPTWGCHLADELQTLIALQE